MSVTRAQVFAGTRPVTLSAKARRLVVVLGVYADGEIAPIALPSRLHLYHCSRPRLQCGKARHRPWPGGIAIVGNRRVRAADPEHKGGCPFTANSPLPLKRLSYRVRGGSSETRRRRGARSRCGTSRRRGGGRAGIGRRSLSGILRAGRALRILI